jgi:hypothetical protein
MYCAPMASCIELLLHRAKGTKHCQKRLLIPDELKL